MYHGQVVVWACSILKNALQSIILMKNIWLSTLLKHIQDSSVQSSFINFFEQKAIRTDVIITASRRRSSSTDVQSRNGRKCENAAFYPCYICRKNCSMAECL